MTWLCLNQLYVGQVHLQLKLVRPEASTTHITLHRLCVMAQLFDMLPVFFDKEDDS